MSRYCTPVPNSSAKESVFKSGNGAESRCRQPRLHNSRDEKSFALSACVRGPMSASRAKKRALTSSCAVFPELSSVWNALLHASNASFNASSDTFHASNALLEASNITLHASNDTLEASTALLEVSSDTFHASNALREALSDTFEALNASLEASNDSFEASNASLEE